MGRQPLWNCGTSGALLGFNSCWCALEHGRAALWAIQEAFEFLICSGSRLLKERSDNAAYTLKIKITPGSHHHTFTDFHRLKWVSAFSAAARSGGNRQSTGNQRSAFCKEVSDRSISLLSVYSSLQFEANFCFIWLKLPSWHHLTIHHDICSLN